MQLSFVIRALAVFCICFILRVLYLFAGNSSGKMVEKFIYPEARRDGSVVEDHFGTKVWVAFVLNGRIPHKYVIEKCILQVADPYRWLEDPDSEETQKYVEAENQVTQPYLENCDQWHKINKKLTKLWNYPKYTVPDRHGDYYFSYQNTGLQNQKYVVN